jgi:hypothetical protein
MKWTPNLSRRRQTIDYIGAALLTGVAPLMARLAKQRVRNVPSPRATKVMDRWGFSLIPHHYYEPITLPKDIRADLAAERQLPGINWNADEQLTILQNFVFADELRAIAKRVPSELDYHFEQPFFGPGDAEYLYSMIRKYRPSRLIEVGCGQSTKIIRDAIKKNGAPCEHICIEPYENRWLEKLGVKVIREQVEIVSPELFEALERDDILFIDTSHVIRPQGDVLHLYQQVIPRLAKGVFVHVHDICTPRDYFPEWILQDRRMWNEQYLLEAFLAFNSEFKITGALNWLWHNHRTETDRAFPVLAATSDDDPGSFWFQRC